MAFIPVPDVAHTDLIYQEAGGKIFTNGFDWLKTGGWDSASLHTLNLTLFDAWVEAIQSMITSNITLIAIKSVDLSAADGAYDEITPSTGNVGTRAGSITALHTTVVITKKTALRGRSYRGRLYHSGYATGDTNGPRRWDATSVANLEAQYGIFLAAVEDEEIIEHVVVSRQNGNVVLAEGVATEVTDLQGRINFGTQRRRVKPA